MISITKYVGNKSTEQGANYVFCCPLAQCITCHTKKRFSEILEILGGKINIVEQKIDEQGNGFIFMNIDRYINESLFWDMSELPVNANSFIDYANGELVNCYYYQVPDTNITNIYRPNPNAKNVYKPYKYSEVKHIVD